MRSNAFLSHERITRHTCAWNSRGFKGTTVKLKKHSNKSRVGNKNHKAFNFETCSPCVKKEKTTQEDTKTMKLKHFQRMSAVSRSVQEILFQRQQNDRSIDQRTSKAQDKQRVNNAKILSKNSNCNEHHSEILEDVQMINDKV